MPIEPSALETLIQQLLIGVTNGAVFALIALGYTMVYGIIELINFAHGDLFMLGSFLALTLVGLFGLTTAGPVTVVLGVLMIVVACAVFCASLNWSVDRIVYRPLRNAPKLAPLVSAIGVSFIFQNLGLFWGGLTGRKSALFGLVWVLVVTPIAGVVLTMLRSKYGNGGNQRIWKWVPLGGTVAAGLVAFILGLTATSLKVDVFDGGRAAAAPKDVPNLISNDNLMGVSAVGARFAGGTVEEVSSDAQQAGLRVGDRVAAVNGAAVAPGALEGAIASLKPGREALLSVERDGGPQELRLKVIDRRTIRYTLKDLVVILTTVPLMVGLTLFVKYTRLGKAMRATAQNPVAARLMGIDVDRVIGATFLIGGGLAGAASVIYGLYINTINYQIGYQNGLYAFTAAVIGGIGNIPGAMLGGILIGVIRAMSDQYIGAQWQPAVLFGILILILIFRPTGLLGARTRDKV